MKSPWTWRKRRENFDLQIKPGPQVSRGGDTQPEPTVEPHRVSSPCAATDRDVFARDQPEGAEALALEDCRSSPGSSGRGCVEGPGGPFGDGFQSPASAVALSTL
jgi:hypothetical protein